jgi:hypothetical protein
VLLAVALATTAVPAAGEMNSGRVAEPAKASRTPQPTYSVKAGLDGEIFPVFANFASFQQPKDRKWATVSVKISNSSNSSVERRVTVEIPGWSDREIQIVQLEAGEVQTLRFAPSFLSRLYHNREIAAASALVTISDLGGHAIFTSTIPVRLRASEDMLWGPNFKYAAFIASWVTPHDQRVEQVLSRAKEFMPGRRMPGYEGAKTPALQAKSTAQQARAIYRALQAEGVSYVKSSKSFGARINASTSERVRLPRESLGRAAANCIDGAVLYASLFENLGMDTVVVLVPGHAYVGVRRAEGSDDYLYIETALTGRATFDAAVRAAESGLARYTPAQITRIAITEARQSGIFPMPDANLSRATVQTSHK